VTAAAAAAVGIDTVLGGSAPAVAAGAPLAPYQRYSAATARGSSRQMTAPSRRHRRRLCRRRRRHGWTRVPSFEAHLRKP